MKKNYELVVVLKGSESDKNRADTLEELKKIITDSKAEVEKTEEWGKKRLAFPVKKEDEGAFYSFNFSTEKINITLPKKVKVASGVIRYLVREKPKEKTKN